MNENESTLKALSMIAAELYIQNHISIAIDEGYEPGYPYVDDEITEKLASHFKNYFEGEGFFPGSVAKFTPVPRKRDS
jgi:hypothetical protein